MFRQQQSTAHHHPCRRRRPSMVRMARVEVRAQSGAHGRTQMGNGLNQGNTILLRRGFQYPGMEVPRPKPRGRRVSATVDDWCNSRG